MVLVTMIQRLKVAGRLDQRSQQVPQGPCICGIHFGAWDDVELYKGLDDTGEREQIHRAVGVLLTFVLITCASLVCIDFVTRRFMLELRSPLLDFQIPQMHKVR